MKIQITSRWSGRTPAPDMDAELARLRREIGEAEKNFRDHPSHFHEIRLEYARVALEDFVAWTAQ